MSEMIADPTTRPGGLTRLSAGLFRWERRLMQLCIGGLLTLTVAAIAATAINKPLYWVAEASVSLMLFTTFLGQSMLVHVGGHPAVTVVTDALGARYAAILRRMIDVLLFMLAALYLVLAWRLFDPLEVIAADFRLMDFAIATGNFTYQEPTNTLGISKAWIWLAPVPTFAFMAIHTVARLFAGPVSHREESL